MPPRKTRTPIRGQPFCRHLLRPSPRSRPPRRMLQPRPPINHPRTRPRLRALQLGRPHSSQTGVLQRDGALPRRLRRPSRGSGAHVAPDEGHAAVSARGEYVYATRHTSAQGWTGEEVVGSGTSARSLGPPRGVPTAPPHVSRAQRQTGTRLRVKDSPQSHPADVHLQRNRRRLPGSPRRSADPT